MRASRCRTILVVEDDDDIREMLAQALELEGYQVMQAANGRAGLDVLDNMDVHPCLVLLDLMMPVLSGWDFLKEIKKGNADIIASLPVYVVSAAGDQATEVQKQANGFIKKPIDLDQVFSIVERHCG